MLFNVYTLFIIKCLDILFNTDRQKFILKLIYKMQEKFT